MNYILLGASRGLGWATGLQLSKTGHQVFSYSRKTTPSMDFTKTDQLSNYLEQWRQNRAEVLICFAGGGPYAAYGEKEFKDHEWAFRLNLLFPAQLLHRILREEALPGLKQICFIGSAIAENKPDPKAASYSAAKHGLRGLVSSVQLEPHGSLDIRLFSPGYMDTSMLPPGAEPRLRGQMKAPHFVAGELLTWLQDPGGVNQQKSLE